METLKNIINTEKGLNPSKIKKLLLKCIENGIKKNIELYLDTVYFLNYLKTFESDRVIKNISMQMGDNLNKDKLLAIYHRNLGKDKTRLYLQKYHIEKVIVWISKFRNLNPSSELRDIITDNNVFTRYELDKLFTKYYGNTYTYFENKLKLDHSNVENYFSRWNSPKFIITKNDEPVGEQIRYEKEFLGGIIQGENSDSEDDDEETVRLKRSQKYANKVTDQTLLNDLESLREIVHIVDGNARVLKFWEYDVFPYIKNKLRLTKERRYILYIYSVWLTSLLDLDFLINTVNQELNLTLDKSDFVTKNKFNLKFWNRFFNENPTNKYASKFNKYDNYMEIIENYLIDQNVDNYKSILAEIRKSIPQNVSRKNFEDVTYYVLKKVMKITRSHVHDIFLQ